MTAEIQAAVKERKGSVQSPKQVIVVDSVPVTGAGQAGQEGRPRAVLGGRGPGRRLSPRERAQSRGIARRVARRRARSRVGRMGDVPTAEIQQTVDAVWRMEAAKIVATLTRAVGDVGLAEDLAPTRWSTRSSSGRRRACRAMPAPG